MKILLLGSGGQIGKCLSDQLIQTKNEVIYSTRSDIDIVDLQSTLKYILQIRPDVIINAIAYTSVDAAEENEVDVNLVNNIAIGNIARICKKINCLLVHFSSDYVFDGMSKSPYKENSITNPLGVYGKSKLDSEIVIQATNCRFIIIRTGWVYSEYGNNFLKTMLKLAENNNEINVVKDQLGCPTYAQDIAISVVSMINKVQDHEEFLGIYNYCGDTCCSWYDFCVNIFNNTIDYNLSTPDIINAISTEEYPTLANRPKYSELSCKKIMTNFNIFPSSLELGIINALEVIKNSEFKDK